MPDRSASGSEWPQQEKSKTRLIMFYYVPQEKTFSVEPVQNAYSTGITVRPKSDLIYYSIL